MSFQKYLSLLLIALFVVSCNDDSKANDYGLSIKTNAKNNTITLGESISLSLNNPEGISIQSVTYQLNDKPTETTLTYANGKLGGQHITANVIHDNDTIIVNGTFKVLSNFVPDIYTYEIINTYPHDITSYTQGLEFHNGELYESTGQYGESKLRKVDFATGDVLKNVNLSNGFFAEGLTILNDKLYQLTWQENTGIIYDVNTLEKEGIFRYGKSKEGWGLCNDGTSLYKSDGTERIWTLNTDNFNEDDKIEVYTNKGKIPQLNELEWINGKIYANIYQKNGVVIVEPSTGAVEGVIDFSPLKDMVTQHSELDVLNGIAYNPETQTIFVTGKNWDKLFEVTIKKK
ncbi:glutaminyl-peptide cyclotransferase [Winogradskyella sp. A3E31]|uniref:glutaminyl-peptide cyclotransferase n=1 Tax=Winogradskyella sp. A3E31 TaxID=3349637 RepID=UPI00398A7B2F